MYRNCHAILKRALQVSGVTLAIAFGATTTTTAEVTFEGQTINFLVNYSAGGGTDTAARLIAPYIVEHLPGSPNYIVTNKPGAGGVLGLQYLIDSISPDGLTVGYFAGTVFRWAQGIMDVPEETADLPFVAGRSVNQIFLKPTGFPLTLDNVEGTDQKIFYGTTSPNSQIAIRMQIFMDLMGAQHFNAIPGYSMGDGPAAARSGELDLIETNDSFFGSNKSALLDDGDLDVVGQYGVYSNGTIVPQKGLEDIAVFDAVLRAKQPDVTETPAYRAWVAYHFAMACNNIVVLPPNTPEDIRKVWEEAVLAAYQDPEYIVKLRELGLPEASIMTGTEVKASLPEIKALFDDPEVIAVMEEMIERTRQ